MGSDMRTITWDDEQKQLRMIDQRILPGQFEILAFSDYQEVGKAISTMVVRGAPAIGVAAAFGMVLAALNSKAGSISDLRDDLKLAGRILNEARPTAVNLSWAVSKMLAEAAQVEGNVSDVKEALLSSAKRMADEDVAINKQMAAYGAALIEDGDNIVHHCNTGALATVDWGTALGVIRLAHEQGKKIHVFVDETRPRLQGARLTAWELSQYGISYDVIADGAAGFLMRTKQVQKVFFGADRVASNGDVANKIGSYMLALAAYDNGIPLYSVFPTSTVDLSLQSGDEIDIEERDQDEVLDIQHHNRQVCPTDASARNPAFDVTPHRLISGLITEKGIVYPPFYKNFSQIMQA